MPGAPPNLSEIEVNATNNGSLFNNFFEEKGNDRTVSVQPRRIGPLRAR
jgi:hypothetical protein